MKTTKKIEQIRIKLAKQLIAILNEMPMTQEQKGKLLKITQQRVSQLVNNKLKFSIGRLMHFLTLLNYDVTILVKPTKEQ